MNKQEFLEVLKKELQNNNVREIDDILNDYEEHFTYKLELGCTEEEISRKLGDPKQIAKEYEVKEIEVKKSSFEKFSLGFGVGFVSFLYGLLYIFMMASVFVIAVFSLASLVLGVCLITTLNIANLIPFIPYFPALIIGISALGLSVVSFIGSINLFLYVKQWGRVYIRWCKNIFSNNKYPPLSMHPKMSKKLASRLRLISIIGLVVFVGAFALGYFLMCIYAGDFEPWHTWNWFV